MYPRNPYDKRDERHNAWESVNHPHGEEYKGQFDSERKLLQDHEDREAGYGERDKDD